MKFAKLSAVNVLAKSHPTWVRGLKFRRSTHNGFCVGVAPHVGAWIEIWAKLVLHCFSEVAPHVGAWIEMPILIVV